MTKKKAALVARDPLATAKERTLPPIWNYLRALDQTPDDPRVVEMLRDWAAQEESGLSLLDWYSVKAVERATEGDVYAAQEVLDAFRGHVESLTSDEPDPPPIAVMQYLASAFERIGVGVAADKALGLATSKRGPKDPRATAAKRQSIAAAYEILRRRGLTPVMAAARLAALGISPARTLTRARSEYPWMDRPEHYPDVILEGLLLPEHSPKLAANFGTSKKR